MEMQPRFVARGNAVAFAGRVTRLGDREVDQLIDVQGNSASLPVTGGLSRAETGRVVLLHDETWPSPIVTFSAGSTRTWDEPRGDSHVTHVMAKVEELAIAGRFFVDRAAGYLRSTYKAGADEPEIEVVQPTIVRMRCDDHEIDVKWRIDLLNRTSTFAALEKAWGRSRAGDGLDQLVMRPRGARPHDPAALPVMKGHVVVALAELAWAGRPHPEVKLEDHVMTWPGFGSVYVGEMIISHHLRRMTLLRLALGSPFAMNAASIDIESDGITLP
jgi:hypothetical protein